MHPEATPSTAPAQGAPGERRPEPRQDAAAPRGPGGGSWRLPAAVAALSAACLSYLGPGCWQDAGGAGPCTVLLRLSLYLGCAAAAFLLGTLLSLVCRSPRAPPPDFAAARRHLAAAGRRGPGVSTGLPRPRAPARPSRLPAPAARPGSRAGRRGAPSSPAPAPQVEAGSRAGGGRPRGEA